MGGIISVQAGTARADDAEVVSLTGKGDSRIAADAEWRPTTVKAKLRAGWFVRTREASQMALVMKDGTQLRLNQLSILNIKAVATAGQPPTRLELPQGRVWAQAKSRSTDVAAAEKAKAPIIEVSTPAAIANIRGTDWELVVDEKGAATITVLSGEVEFYNEHGRVAVRPNEQARAVPGKAPTKTLLTNAAERVQWVTAYRPQPRRWVRDFPGGLEAIAKNIEAQDYAPALAALTKDKALPRLPASLLLADLAIFQGQAADAIAILGPHAADGKGDPMASALLGRALLVAGRIADAERVLASAVATHPRHTEALLSRAELARVQGDAAAARAAAMKVLEVDPKNAEAWYVIGRIETEREYVTAARDALERALAAQPDGAGYRGELASLETFANEFERAEKIFGEALDRQPDDYVALTGLGILQLKRGQTEAALESFLKAGVIEPRYARAWLFSAAAYYQLGERARALEALQKASSLDDKDPLPYFMSSLVHYDALDFGRAIEEARKAQERLPYLKSLNQMANDQKGSANVGSALAAFGMEEWSQAYAYNSYNPYWAGSPLFLADRFTGTYNKNSELFKGFLSDPTVFGASNRFSSLVPVPGHYGSVGITGARDDFSGATFNATLNGYSVASKPFSYFLSYDRLEEDSSSNLTRVDGDRRLTGNNGIVGLGIKPTHELGLFAFLNGARYDAKLELPRFGFDNQGRTPPTGNALSVDVVADYWRIDVGLNYKFSPTNHGWLKYGDSSEKQSASGPFLSQQIVDTFNARFPTLPPIQSYQALPTGRLNKFGYERTGRDIQWRHTFDLATHLQVTWGIEYSEQDTPTTLDYQFPVTFVLSNGFLGRSAFQNINTLDDQAKAANGYVSGRAALTPFLEVQADLYYQDVESTFLWGNRVLFVGQLVPLPPVSQEFHDRELNPRLGFRWRFAPAHTLRVAGQMWRRPPGVNTLAPVDTMGIAIDDQTVIAGGLLKRARLQHEMELSRSTFAQWFVDFKEIDNPRVGLGDELRNLRLVDLERLRQRKRVYAIPPEYLEDTPRFGMGEIRMFGLAFNHLITRDATVAARYTYADTENTGFGFSGKMVPYHPKHYANFQLTWRPYARWIVGPVATYRSSRYGDEENTQLLTAGWAFGLQAYWESEDKRVSIGGLVNQIHSDKQSSIYRHPVAQVQAVLRF